MNKKLKRFAVLLVVFNATLLCFLSVGKLFDASVNFSITIYGTVEGTVGNSELNSNEVYIYLEDYSEGDGFIINEPVDITEWFNLDGDSGLMAEGTLIDEYTILATLSGTPLKELSGPIKVTVPADYIDACMEAITSEDNDEAFYNIVDITPIARFYSDNTVSGNVGETLAEDRIYVEVVNATIDPVACQSVNIDSEIDNGLSAYIEDIQDNVLTIVYSGIPNKEDHHNIDITLPKEIFGTVLNEDLIVSQNDKEVKFNINLAYKPSVPVECDEDSK